MGPRHFVPHHHLTADAQEHSQTHLGNSRRSDMGIALSDKYLGGSRGSMHINTLILTDQYKQYNTMLYSQINTTYIHELLVGCIPTPLNNMSSSAGMMTFPIYGKS